MTRKAQTIEQIAIVSDLIGSAIVLSAHSETRGRVNRIISVFALVLILVASSADAASERLSDAIRLYENGFFKQAVELLRQETKASPRDAEIRFWLGRSYLNARDWKAAVTELEKAVEFAPSNAQYRQWLGRASGERASHAFIITAYSMARQVVREFENARRLAPDDLSIRFDLLEYYLQAPGMVGGGKIKAEVEARAIAEIDRQKGFTARAKIFIADKRFDEAKAELHKATDEFPESADACEGLADFLFEQQDIEGALQWSKKALALNPGMKFSRFLAASAATLLRRDLESATDELLALAAGPLYDDDASFEQIYYRLGENYLARGDKEKAKAAFQSAISYNPENSGAREALKKL